jgi:hypothetical protein
VPEDEEAQKEQARGGGYGSLAKPIEDTNLDEIVQLLKLLQEVMRLSSEAERAQARLSAVPQQAVDTLSSNALRSGALPPQARFLAEGSTEAMRCAKLLAYLMVEFEVPVVVRHAVRCARVFFFGAVDFEKLELCSAEQLQSLLAKKEAEKPNEEAPARKLGRQPSELEGACQNHFLVATLRKIGERISNTEGQQDEPEAKGVEEQQMEPTSLQKTASAPVPEPSSLVAQPEKEEQKEEQIDSREQEEKSGDPLQADTAALASTDPDRIGGRKYVVYANINSQTEDFTFLLTALYHWEKLHPVIGPTQPQDPAPFVQKAVKVAKKDTNSQDCSDKQQEKIAKKESASGALAAAAKLLVEPKEDAIMEDLSKLDVSYKSESPKAKKAKK